MIIPKRFALIAGLVCVLPILSLYAGFPAQADLAVMKSGPAQAGADTDVTYTIEVDNFGPDDGASVKLTDSVPANMTFVSFQQTSGPTWSCSTPTAGSTGTITCNIATL